MDGEQVSPVTLQVLNGLIEAQTKLRDAAEKRWSFAREALFNLARLVATDWLEERQQQKGGLELVRIEELSQVVFERVTALHSAYVHPDVEQLRKAQTRLAELGSQLDQATLLCNGLQRERDEALQEIALLKTQAEVNKTPSASTPAKTPPVVIAPESVSSNDQAAPPAPNWFQEWTDSDGFEKQEFVIRFMGDTGLSLRPEIMRRLTDHYNVARTSGACVRAFTSLVNNSFILTQETDGGLKGRPPHTVRLGNLGESAYILLTGKQAERPEFDEIRSAHGTDAHTLLIIKAAAILEAEGYEMLSKGEMAFKRPNGHTTSPDILVRKNGKDLRVEVERNTAKGDQAARDRKWQGAFDAGDGCLYVFCETDGIQKKLSQEIKRALASEGRLERASLYMTNLEAIGKNERHPDGSIWISQKRP